MFLAKEGSAGVKKTKGRAKGRVANKSAAKREKRTAKVASNPADEKLANMRTEKDPDPVDFAEVRKIIATLVRISAKHITEEVIKVAETGQLAPAKYLFEAVGLYPPTELTAVRPIETTLAHTLLTRMGLPLDPVVCDEDAPGVTSEAKGTATKPTEGAKEDPGGDREAKAVPTEGEE